MKKEDLSRLIQTASGGVDADLVIKNCKVVDVFSGGIIQGDVALCGDRIAGVGSYKGAQEVDAQGRYAAPGFIDSHIHIESSFLTPEELGRLLVPCGATTIIADPHEIVNVCGIRGLDYMMAAAQKTALDIQFMLPSCVPATPFEHAGAVVDAVQMAEPITRDAILGLGEFMDVPGVVGRDSAALDKLLVAKNAGKLIDGHSPGLGGLALNAYAAVGIQGDHECSTLEEMRARLSRGIYVLLREGSACRDLRTLLRGVTPGNSRRCLFCSDDRQPRTILEEGHIDNHLRICVEEGLDPITALRMATLNAAECFRLYDRGAIAPGYRADILLLDDLKGFRVSRVWIGGRLAAADGSYLLPVEKQDISPVLGSVRLKDFSKEKLQMRLRSGRVHVIRIQPGGVLTKKTVETVALDAEGQFVRDPERDIVKMAVVERHQLTGNVACGLLAGYGIRRGAIALSVAHDSHNIITVGVSDEEMAFAVSSLQALGGGIVLVRDGRVVEELPLPIAGLMTDQSGRWVEERLAAIHEKAHTQLGVSRAVEPVMTLCFMSLAVIPELKLTDMGLFDMTTSAFIPIEAEA